MKTTISDQRNFDTSLLKEQQQQPQQQQQQQTDQLR